MRYFERQPEETPKGYEAFVHYRDLGRGRTLAKAAESYYGSTSNLRQIQEWSRRFSWVDRALAFDDFLELERRAAVEEHIRTHAHEIEEQRHALRRRMLAVADKAVARAEAILDSPMYRSVERVEEGPDGEDVRIVIHNPANWNTNTARHLFLVAAKAIEPVEVVDDQPEIVFDALTDDEVESIAANNGDVRRALDDGRLREVRKLPGDTTP